MIIAANNRAFIGDACADAQTLPRESNDMLASRHVRKTYRLFHACGRTTEVQST
jgi:hypothetical protein